MTLGDLSPRQRQVAQFVGDGRTAPWIARQLGISTRTAEKHVADIAAKLGNDGSFPRQRIMAWVRSVREAA